MDLGQTGQGADQDYPPPTPVGRSRHAPQPLQRTTLEAMETSPAAESGGPPDDAAATATTATGDGDSAGSAAAGLRPASRGLKRQLSEGWSPSRAPCVAGGSWDYYNTVEEQKFPPGPRSKLRFCIFKVEILTSLNLDICFCKMCWMSLQDFKFSRFQDFLYYTNLFKVQG